MVTPFVTEQNERHFPGPYTGLLAFLRRSYELKAYVHGIGEEDHKNAQTCQGIHFRVDARYEIKDDETERFKDTNDKNVFCKIVVYAISNLQVFKRAANTKP